MNILTAKCWLAVFRMLTAIMRRQMRLDALSIKNASNEELQIYADFTDSVRAVLDNNSEITRDIKEHFGID